MANVDFPEAVIPKKTTTSGDDITFGASSQGDIAIRQLKIPRRLL
jgi:hypothetical protein